MMSRSKTLPSLSSSRQMTMAWKVSGLSQSPAIIASRPASMRLATAISPSRERSFTDAILPKYVRTGSSVRSAGALAVDLAGSDVCRISASSLSPSVSSSSSGSSWAAASSPSRAFGLDHVDAHLTEPRQNVLDLLGIDLIRSQQCVDLIVCDIAPPLGGADQRLDGRIGKVEQGPIRRGPGALRPSFSVFWETLLAINL